MQKLGEQVILRRVCIVSLYVPLSGLDGSIKSDLSNDVPQSGFDGPIKSDLHNDVSKSVLDGAIKSDLSSHLWLHSLDVIAVNRYHRCH